MNMTIKGSFYKKLYIIVIISVFLLSIVAIKSARVMLINDLKDKGEGITRILSTVALDALMIHDYATMKRYVRDIEEESFVVKAAITTVDGRVIAGKITDESENTFAVQYPIDIGEKPVGSVWILFSTASVDYISNNILMAAIFIITFLHILGIGLTNMVLNTTVIKPLKRLSFAIQKIKEGNLKERIAIQSPKEFADIANSFNEMTNRIQTSIHEVKESNQSLVLEQAKLSTIVENVADGLFVIDTARTLLSFNKSAERITGYSRQEVLGMKCGTLFNHSLCQQACPLLKSDKILTNMETDLVTKDGRKLLISISYASLYDMDGKFSGSVQTFRDITEMKKRQDFLRQTEKLAVVGQLASGVAHEINNPIGNILGYAQLLAEESPAKKPKQRIDVIIEQARKCKDIVNGLLDYARSSGSDPSEIDLNQIVQKVITLLEYQSEKKNILIKKQMSSLPLIYADGKKIEQVVFNLVLNAIQAIENSGEIHIQTGLDQEEIFLFIADDGSGIQEDIQNRIFDPFFTTKPVGEGTGLGLSICTGIVSELNGRIEVAAKKGRGATFKVYFPLKTLL
jgi:two-component system, NtrC family, sensor kinase